MFKNVWGGPLAKEACTLATSASMNLWSICSVGVIFVQVWEHPNESVRDSEIGIATVSNQGVGGQANHLEATAQNASGIFRRPVSKEVESPLRGEFDEEALWRGSSEVICMDEETYGSEL